MPLPSAMSLLHCPLCVGLAVLSAVRTLAHATLLWQLRGDQSALAPGLSTRSCGVPIGSAQGCAVQV